MNKYFVARLNKNIQILAFFFVAIFLIVSFSTTSFAKWGNDSATIQFATREPYIDLSRLSQQPAGSVVVKEFDVDLSGSTSLNSYICFKRGDLSEDTALNITFTASESGNTFLYILLSRYVTEDNGTIDVDNIDGNNLIAVSNMLSGLFAGYTYRITESAKYYAYKLVPIVIAGNVPKYVTIRVEVSRV